MNENKERARESALAILNKVNHADTTLMLTFGHSADLSYSVPAKLIGKARALRSKVQKAQEATARALKAAKELEALLR